MKKFISAILVITLAQSLTSTVMSADTPLLVPSLVWEKKGHNPRILAEKDGKMLILFDDVLTRSGSVELIDTETGKNTWDGIGNDLGEFVKQKLFYSYWIFLKDLGLLYMKCGYSDDDLACFEFESGRKVWQCAKNTNWPLPRCVEDGIAYGFGSYGSFPGEKTFLVGYDVLTGEEKSRIENDGYRYFYGNVFGKTGNDFYYNDYGYVFTFNMKTFKSKMLLSDDSYGMSYDDDFAFVNGKIIARLSLYNNKCKFTKTITCYDASNEKQLWRYDCLYNFTINDNTIVFTSCDDSTTYKTYFTAFTDIDTGEMKKKVYDCSNNHTNYCSSGNMVAAITDLKNNSSKLTLFDKNGVVLCNEEIVEPIMFGWNEKLFFMDNKIVLPCYDNFVNEYGSKNALLCYELIDTTTSNVFLKDELNVAGKRILDLIRNKAFMAKVDEEGKISDLSLDCALENKDSWPDVTALENTLLGRKFSELDYSCTYNRFYTTILEGDKKSALACFDITTGKQLWANKKLKNFSPPSLYPYISSSSGKEGEIYEIDNKSGYTINHYTLKNKTKPFSIVCKNELAMVVYDGSYSMHYYKSGTKGWQSKEILPKGANPLNAFLSNNTFVSLAADGNNAKVSGKDVFSGKELWSRNIDTSFALNDNIVYASGKSASKGKQELFALDYASGKVLNTVVIPEDLLDGFKLKDIKTYGSAVSLFLEKPNMGSRILVFDKKLEFLCREDFDGMYFANIETGIGRIAATLENSSNLTVETSVMRLAGVKKTSTK